MQIWPLVNISLLKKFYQVGCSVFSLKKQLAFQLSHYPPNLWLPNWQPYSLIWYFHFQLWPVITHVYYHEPQDLLVVVQYKMLLWSHYPVMHRSQWFYLRLFLSPWLAQLTELSFHIRHQSAYSLLPIQQIHLVLLNFHYCLNYAHQCCLHFISPLRSFVQTKLAHAAKLSISAWDHNQKCCRIYFVYI